MKLDDYLKSTLNEDAGGNSPPAEDAVQKMQAEMTVALQKISNDLNKRLDELEKRYDFNDKVDSKEREENNNGKENFESGNGQGNGIDESGKVPADK